jgi:hypothetical protein
MITDYTKVALIKFWVVYFNLSYMAVCMLGRKLSPVAATTQL